jgi:hypothetical protein
MAVGSPTTLPEWVLTMVGDYGDKEQVARTAAFGHGPNS